MTDHLHKFKMYMKNQEAYYVDDFTKDRVIAWGDIKKCECGNMIIIPYEDRFNPVDVDEIYEGKE